MGFAVRPRHLVAVAADPRDRFTVCFTQVVMSVFLQLYLTFMSKRFYDLAPRQMA